MIRSSRGRSASFSAENLAWDGIRATTALRTPNVLCAHLRNAPLSSVDPVNTRSSENCRPAHLAASAADSVRSLLLQRTGEFAGAAACSRIQGTSCIRRTASLSKSEAHHEITSSRKGYSHVPLSSWVGPNSQAAANSRLPPQPQLVMLPVPSMMAPSVSLSLNATLGWNAPLWTASASR